MTTFRTTAKPTDSVAARREAITGQQAQAARTEQARAEAATIAATRPTHEPSDSETREERNERRATLARDALEAAEQALTKAIAALQEAHTRGSATESLILVPVIRAAVDARDTTRFLASARADDAERRNADR